MGNSLSSDYYGRHRRYSSSRLLKPSTYFPSTRHLGGNVYSVKPGEQISFHKSRHSSRRRSHRSRKPTVIITQAGSTPAIQTVPTVTTVPSSAYYYANGDRDYYSRRDRDYDDPYHRGRRSRSRWRSSSRYNDDLYDTDYDRRRRRYSEVDYDRDYDDTRTVDTGYDGRRSRGRRRYSVDDAYNGGYDSTYDGERTSRRRRRSVSYAPTTHNTYPGDSGWGNDDQAIRNGNNPNLGAYAGSNRGGDYNGYNGGQYQGADMGNYGQGYGGNGSTRFNNGYAPSMNGHM